MGCVEDAMKWQKSCFAACDGLTEPEKQIKALVEAARNVISSFHPESAFMFGPFGRKLESALEPFKDYLKGEG